MVNLMNIQLGKKTQKKILTQSNRSRIGILILTTLIALTISGITDANFRPITQISFDTFRITSNNKADYCIITSQNVKEIARTGELCDAYQQAWNNSETRNEKLEKQLDYTLWYFVGGFALGVIVAK
jgi:hypothetical protein